MSKEWRKEREGREGQQELLCVTSRGDVHFNDEWVKTPSGESFLIAEDNDGDDKLIIFGTDKNIELLCESDAIYVDGTFQTCPKLFYQIFTMFYIPVLMTYQFCHQLIGPDYPRFAYSVFAYCTFAY